MNEWEMVQALKSSITPEQRAWFQEQHRLFRLENPVKPLVRADRFTPYKSKLRPLALSSSGATPVRRVLILMNRTLYANATVKEKVDRYVQDIGRGHGCTVEMEVLEGGTHQEIKDILLSYYRDGGLDGAIQIGDLPVAWMEFKSDPFFGNYETWTCDHYYMDLDGQWLDPDNNTFYETHNPGSGDRGSEIFYARIDVKPMGSYGTEVELLSSYLDKVHNYWTGGIELRKSAVDLIEPDWNTSTQNLERVYGASNTTILRNPGKYTRTTYLNTYLQGNYTLLHLWCHSGHTAHSFSDGGSCSYTAVYDANPKPVGYAHDGCHLADWAAARNRGYLGGSYVFNESPTALVCIAGSRTGQWIGHKGQRLFEEMGKNTCVGKSYQLWFDAYCNSSEMTRDVPYFMAWNYGMLILGDPMLTFITRLQTGVENETVASGTIKGYLTFARSGAQQGMIVSYALPQATHVDLRLCDMSGKQVAILANARQSGGNHTLQFSTQGLPNGVYVLSLRSAGFHHFKQITVSR
ncbi:MAG: hypothetical protein JW768_00770 [Chitinispirillaceae bacterium]|nr:hypothetical protein [Chitinispirillaceae bacterium]